MKKSLKVSASMLIATLAFGLSGCGDEEGVSSANNTNVPSSSKDDAVPPGTVTEEASPTLTDEQLESMIREVNIIENAEGDISQADFDVLLEKYETTEEIYRTSLDAYLKTDRGQAFVKTLPAAAE